jgi:hypothetical protein
VDYNLDLNRIKLFFRWLTNKHIINKTDWKTPDFLQIRERRSKRRSPYSENNIWDRDELLIIIKYEPEIRNKAILALLYYRNENDISAKWRQTRDSFVHQIVPYGELMVRGISVRMLQ